MKRKLDEHFFSDIYQKHYKVVGSEKKYPTKCKDCAFYKDSCNGALDETGDCLPTSESNDEFDGNFIFIEVNE